MPIFSYLVTPVSGEMNSLVSELNHTNYCEAVPANNEELIILVTETPDEQAEKDLQRKLKRLQSIQSVSMTYGHADDQE